VETVYGNEQVLVTGGAGFIGSHLVDALVEGGHKVRILDSLDPQVHGEKAKPPDCLPSQVDVRIGSLLDPDVLNTALDGVDIVFHQAAVVGVGQSMYEIARYCENNTLGAARLLEAIVARRDRIRKVVVASSMSIYGEGAYVDEEGGRRIGRRSPQALAIHDWDVYEPGTRQRLYDIATDEEKCLEPSSVYAINKRDHEELFLTVGRAYEIPTVALRYFNAYGSRQALSNPYTGVGAIFACRVLAGHRPCVFEDGQQKRDFVHVSDVVKANVLAMETDRADYQALNIGSGEPISVLEVARAVALSLGREDLVPDVTGRYRQGDIRHCYADITKARRLLGYEPSVRFVRGVTELVEWAAHQEASDTFDDHRQELARRGLSV
jgi:dTDP-L-rhamnose 4-epimerase